MDSPVSGRHPMYQNVPVIFNSAARSKQRFLDTFILLLSTLHTAVHIHGLDRLNMKDLSKKINKTPCLKFFTFLLDIESKAKTSAFLNNLLNWYILLLPYVWAVCFYRCINIITLLLLNVQSTWISIHCF